MAKFYVEYDFRIPDDAEVSRLSRGAVYMAGDTITGLTAAEARELLALAPADTFSPADDEAESVAEYVAASHTVEINRRLDPSGDVGKGL